MSRTELVITWVISAFPLVFLVLLVTTDLLAFTKPWTSLAFLGVYYFKFWVLSDAAAVKARQKRMRRPISKAQGILILLVFPGFVALALFLNWLDGLVGRDAIVAGGISVVVIFWLKECRDAWKKYVAVRALPHARHGR